MQKLIRGIIQFQQQLTEERRELFARLALGQRPDALFIACSDSRVVPNLFASTEPGDLFVVRNPGNVVPPWDPENPDQGVLASLEFAVVNLRVLDIIVCGHSDCGAVRAVLAGGGRTPGLKQWLTHLAGVDAVPLSGPGLGRSDRCSQQNVLLQVEHLRTYPFVAEAEAGGQVRLHAWWFDIGQARVLEYDPGGSCFRLIGQPG